MMVPAPLAGAPQRGKAPARLRPERRTQRNQHHNHPPEIRYGGGQGTARPTSAPHEGNVRVPDCPPAESQLELESPSSTPLF